MRRAGQDALLVDAQAFFFDASQGLGQQRAVGLQAGEAVCGGISHGIFSMGSVAGFYGVLASSAEGASTGDRDNTAAVRASHSSRSA